MAFIYRAVSKMITLIKKTFNISGCTISIQPDKSEFHQGDKVNCEVLITGGEFEQNADEITLALEESWVEGSGDNSRTVRIDRVKEAVASNVSLKPGESHRFEFSAQLPDNSRHSSGSSTTGWCLVVNVDVSNARDPKERLNIKVIPHREFLAIYNACISILRFTHNSSEFDYWKVRFIPPNALLAELDCLDLDLSQEGLTTNCELIFDLQEKSVADYFKMVFNQDKVKREIQFSRDELFNSSGEANHQGIAKKIAAEMKQVIEGRD
jgi:sporulation-control protein spo0M